MSLQQKIPVFLLGMLVGILVTLFILPTTPSPYSLLTGNTIAAISPPSDWILPHNILIGPDRIVIFINNASISHYEPTGSMGPLFPLGANGIRIRPTTPESIAIGDIISFRNNEGTLIVHRVTEIGSDEKGTYYITKGDTNTFYDTPIYFNEIEWVTIGILW